MAEIKTVTEHFAGHFEHSYDGRQDDEKARADFIRLTNYEINWTQVHGDFKDAAKRELFVPYRHWQALHECCGRAVRQWAKDNQFWQGSITGARIMQDAMTILRGKYGLNAPKWWIPLMRQMRG